MFLLRFAGTGFGSSCVREVWAMSDAVSGDVGRFVWAASSVVGGVGLGAWAKGRPCAGGGFESIGEN